MYSQKIYELREAARRAHENYKETGNRRAYEQWRRLLKQLRQEIENYKKAD